MDQNTTTCPFCREEVKVGASICKHCRSQLATDPNQTANVSAAGGLGLLPGSLVGAGRFEIRGLIGQGGMGEVYLAHHLFADRPVAIKALFPRLMGDPSLRQRFLEEGRTMARLDHRCIVKFMDVFAEGTNFFLVMEYIPGKSLAKAIEGLGGQQQTLGIPECLEVLKGVASGLAYAHGQTPAIVHRDIKPANIMLDSVGKRVVVMDFGIAKVIGRRKLTSTMGVLGTYEYMSPEQVVGAEISPASDVYSVGIVGYELLVGDVPFPQTGDTPVAVMDGHRFTVPAEVSTLRPDCPRWLSSVVARCLEKDPARRFPSAAELLSQLEAGESAAMYEPVAAGEANRALFDSASSGATVVETRPASVPTWEPAERQRVASEEVQPERPSSPGESHTLGEQPEPAGQIVAGRTGRPVWPWVAGLGAAVVIAALVAVAVTNSQKDETPWTMPVPASSSMYKVEHAPKPMAWDEPAAKEAEAKRRAEEAKAIAAKHAEEEKAAEAKAAADKVAVEKMAAEDKAAAAKAAADAKAAEDEAAAAKAAAEAKALEEAKAQAQPAIDGFNAIFRGIAENKAFETIFLALPAGHVAAINAAMIELAGRVDRKVFSKAMYVVDAYFGFIADNKAAIVTALVAEMKLEGDAAVNAAEVTKVVDAVLAIWPAFVADGWNTLAAWKAFDLAKFMGTLAKVETALHTTIETIAEPMKGRIVAPLAVLGNLRAALGSVDGARVTLNVMVGDSIVGELAVVEVEGKWVPELMADRSLIASLIQGVQLPAQEVTIQALDAALASIPPPDVIPALVAQLVRSMEPAPVQPAADAAPM